MREYGGSGSSPMMVMRVFGACLRMVSAAMTPAGPAPRMTWWVMVYLQKRKRSSEDRLLVALRIPEAAWGSLSGPAHRPAALP